MKHAVFVFVFAVGMTAQGLAAPKPAAVQRAGQWTLDVRYSQPLQISVRLPGQQGPRRFWYTILTLTNNNTVEDDVSLCLQCQLVTDTFKTLPAGKDVRREVFEKIKLKHQGQYPFLESMDFKDTRLRKGADNTRDIVIIWPDFDPAAKRVNLFIAGLSNEATAVDHPIQKDADGKPTKVYLQKTLQLIYGNPTDPALQSQASLVPIKQDWVMR
jgi:hypothetical protein